jgi:hypothetical protein
LCSFEFICGYCVFFGINASTAFGKKSLYLSRFAEILGAIRLSSAGEAVEFWIGGYSGNLVMHSITAQHAEMPVMISTAGTFRLVGHLPTSFHLSDSVSKSVPILAGNVLKENA